ncbi:MAG: ArsR/SmtB family transcription factor [Thermocladium sp.]
MQELLGELESFFSALADETRLRIVLHLLEKGASTVQEISAGIGKSESLVSHHLSCLRNCGIVRYTRSGRNAVYEVNGGEVREVIQLAIRHTRRYSESILSCDVLQEEKGSPIKL